MSNTTTATENVIFDPAIHATDAEGNPVIRKDGSFALKRGRKPGSTGVTITRKGFDVTAVSAAYLARIMAMGGDSALAALTDFSMMKPSEKVAFLATTPEYAETVTVKVVTDAAEKINAILDAAGIENYSAIMELVRFGK